MAAKHRTLQMANLVPCSTSSSSRTQAMHRMQHQAPTRLPVFPMVAEQQPTLPLLGSVQVALFALTRTLLQWWQRESSAGLECASLVLWRWQQSTVQWSGSVPSQWQTEETHWGCCTTMAMVGLIHAAWTGLAASSLQTCHLSSLVLHRFAFDTGKSTLLQMLNLRELKSMFLALQ